MNTYKMKTKPKKTLTLLRTPQNYLHCVHAHLAEIHFTCSNYVLSEFAMIDVHQLQTLGMLY